jgi:Ala-tRNA(Pro) deacylase
VVLPENNLIIIGGTMPAKMLKDFLDQNKIKYVTITHSLSYTAQEIAASAHIKGKGLAKTVLVKISGKMSMTVLPASYRIDFDKLKEIIGTEDIRLANEQEFKDRFPGCEVGAMPPFGNLYNLDTYVAASLVEDEEIAFNSGTHTELIRMQYNDFERLVKPKILRFSSKYKT